MVRNYYPLRLIKGGFSPTNFAMFYTTDAVSDTGVLYLQDKVSTWLTIYKIDSPCWRPTVLLVLNWIVRLWFWLAKKLYATNAPTKTTSTAAAANQGH